MDTINSGWRRSSRCESGNCVEWRDADGQIEVRNSNNADGPILRFDRAEWAVFVEGLVAEAQRPR